MKPKSSLKKVQSTKALTIKQKKVQAQQLELIIKRNQDKILTKLNVIQKKFLTDLDKLYKDNFNKIEETNKKYSLDLYKCFNDVNNVNDTGENSKINQLRNAKSVDINEIESDFIIKKNCILLQYNTEICKLREWVVKELNNEGNKLIAEYKKMKSPKQSWK